MHETNLLVDMVMRKHIQIHKSQYPIMVWGLILCASIFFTGCVTTPPEEEVPISTVDASTFDALVLQRSGPVIVLFNDYTVASSQDMQKRFEYFSEKYSEEIKFLTFNWDVSVDNELFNLSALPTTVFYYDGAEIDRIGGIPSDTEVLREWNNDIDLWILKTVLGVQGDDYSGRYVYRFNDTARLHIGNY